MARSIVERWQSVSLVGWAFILIAISLAIAAWLNAPLTWDGSYYLFAMLDSHEPFIAQKRIADKYLHYPVVAALNWFDSQSAAWAIFNILHVVTPLVALGLSWWVVRRVAPHLMLWPMLCIGLAMLPGQMNFISEGIKADQLMWPLLLALMIGLPNRTIPVAVVLAVSIYTLHPVSAPIIAACGLAAVVLAFFQREVMWRLITAGVALILAGIYRFNGVNSSYEQSEMTWETQSRQWSNGAGGLPTVALIGCAIVAVLSLCRPWISSRYSRHIDLAQLVTLIVGGMTLVIWSLKSSNWWEALEYRGPAFWVSMIAAGCLFLHVLSDRVRGTKPANVPGTHILVIGATFALVIIVQSIGWNRAVSGMDEQLQGASQACVAREDLEGYPYTPLNLWSTNSLSILLQDQEPAVISMRSEDCHAANQTGEVFLTDSQRAYSPTHYDFSAIETQLPAANVCSWLHTTGWHQQEALIPDSWRWSDGTGSIDVTMEESGIVLLRGEFRTYPTPNTIQVSIHGAVIDEFELTTDASQPFTVVPIQLPAGPTTIQFASSSEAAIPEGDGRPLAFSLWNLDIRPNDGSSPCLQLDRP